MNPRNNYEIAKINARKTFLQKDQDHMIQKFDLEHDDTWLYLVFLYEKYRICRADGAVERQQSETSWCDCSFEEVLSVYDLLGHSDEKPHIAGEWRLVNALPGVAHTSGLGDHFFDSDTGRFMEKEEKFMAACKALGAAEVSMGDLGFRFEIMKGLPIILRIYRADEEFGAQISIMWDKNTLDFLYYETTYYVAKVLCRRIRESMENPAD